MLRIATMRFALCLSCPLLTPDALCGVCVWRAFLFLVLAQNPFSPGKVIHPMNHDNKCISDA
jgi:hypothetical protein